MHDFIRFFPERLEDLGFRSYVIFAENGCAVAIDAESPEELRKKLRKVREDVLVGVIGRNRSVCREAVMRKKVDVLLDCDERELDYGTIKLAAEKDVTIELGMSKFLRARGLRRAKLFDQLREEVRIIRKFDAPFVVTTAAESVWELRSRKQVETFFAFFGCDIGKARGYAERLVRRYFDPNYIMDGFEVEKS
ncbi:MAG: RNase P subunit p30 family protein [Archaeoglobaceae archaeon]